MKYRLLLSLVIPWRSDFGDVPYKTFCASGDGVCELHGFYITAAHLSYGSGTYIEDAVDFIVDTVGSSMVATSSDLANTTSPASSDSATSVLDSLGLSSSDSSSVLSGLSSGIDPASIFSGLGTSSGTDWTSLLSGLESSSSSSSLSSLSSGFDLGSLFSRSVVS